MAANVFHATFKGKQWRIASIHGHRGYEWGWLINIDNPEEQCRLSLRSEFYNDTYYK